MIQKVLQTTFIFIGLLFGLTSYAAADDSYSVSLGFISPGEIYVTNTISSTTISVDESFTCIGLHYLAEISDYCEAGYVFLFQNSSSCISFPFYLQVNYFPFNIDAVPYLIVNTGYGPLFWSDDNGSYYSTSLYGAIGGGVRVTRHPVIRMEGLFAVNYFYGDYSSFYGSMNKGSAFYPRFLLIASVGI